MQRHFIINMILSGLSFSILLAIGMIIRPVNNPLILSLVIIGYILLLVIVIYNYALLIKP